MRHLRSLSLLTLLSAALAAHADVLTFENIPGTAGPFFTNYDSPVTTGGYRIASTQGFIAWTPSSPSQTGYALYTGSVALSANSSTITMDRPDGSAFDLTSMDIASAWTAAFTTDYMADRGIAPEIITFTGTKMDGGTVTQTTTPILNDKLNPVVFAGFTNLQSVSWTQDAPFHQFDNVNVAVRAQATPEPASLAALAVGATALLRRRKRV